MAEKRKSSEKSNIGKKLALGLIAVISLPILLVGLAGIIIMHLVQNTALNAGVGTIILIVVLAVFVAGSLWLAVAIAGKLKAVIGSMDKIADGSLQLEEPKHNEKNDEICIAPSDKKIGISIKYSKSSLPSLTRFMSKNNIKFPIKYYIQTNDSSNSYFLATSEFVDENILIERVLKLIKKDNLSAMKSDSMEKLLNLYDSFIKSYIRKRKYSFIPLEDRLSLGKEGFIHAIQTYNPNICDFNEHLSQQLSRHLDRCSVDFKYKYKEAIPLEKRDENGSTYEVFAHPNSQKAFEDVNTRYDLSRELDPIILNVYSLQKAGYTRPEICKKLHINACLYNHYNSCLKKALQTYSL